jgi:hypothetical protein
VDTTIDAAVGSLSRSIFVFLKTAAVPSTISSSNSHSNMQVTPSGCHHSTVAQLGSTT